MLLAAGLAAVSARHRRPRPRRAGRRRGAAAHAQPQPLAAQSHLQLDLARATATLGAARAYLHDQVGQLWDVVCAGSRPTLLQRAEGRLAAHHAAAEAARAVDLAFTAAGGSAVYSDSALQRCLRDVHVATQHAMVSPRLLETFAKVRLGIEADTALL